MRHGGRNGQVRIPGHLIEVGRRFSEGERASVEGSFTSVEFLLRGCLSPGYFCSLLCLRDGLLHESPDVLSPVLSALEFVHLYLASLA
jgi:hypothetical protein